ncbi:hypothetical protein GA830_13295 [Mesorhizobium sp. NBSH29]|uniref:hypothetical protein n=1 Tax=Mesorhizobium sp. NBSH29 TaxID=2654249 RepID=UPI0018964C15|nr:hypothetical protein [Mesorhizobium sp. NBSH29]QPC87613.1 hypothetical protein GA830_13295 [Mesorhizobium sp. NBSH29]
MSDDPETARQIAELARDTRPLLVVDVDEVLLEFVGPFIRFLAAQDLALQTQSFKLRGNIVDAKSRAALDDERVATLLTDFFAFQVEWQTPGERASQALAELANDIEIVMLTAMPHRHRATRRTLLDTLGFPYPLLTTEHPKGPAIRSLRGLKPRPVAFVDDIAHNHVSVREAVSDAHLFHLMLHDGFRAVMPALPDGVTATSGWDDAVPKIATALGVAHVQSNV